MLRRLLLVSAAALAVTAAEPVPTPVHVQPGAADADGTVEWTPAVQVVTGDPGEVVAVDLALDNGSGHEVEARLDVREVDVHPRRGPERAGTSRLLTVVARRAELRPGDRGALRATAEVPSEPTLVGVEARLVDDAEDAAPMALVLVGPPREVEIDVSVAVADGRAEVTVTNRSPFAGVVDLAVASDSWPGAATTTHVTDVLVAGEGTRVVAVDVPRGLGPTRVEVAAAPRGADPAATERASVSVWRARAGWALLAGVLVLLVGSAAVRVLRRS